MKQEIYVGKFKYNNDNGYNINIHLEFLNIDNNKQGYINLDAVFKSDNNINSFINEEYNGIPFDSDDEQFIFFEIFDTDKFLDTEIKSKIFIKLKDIKNNKMNVLFELNDKLIKIKFDDYLNIKFN